VINNGDIEFTQKLIKGKITETIFEMMFRHTGKYKLLHFGYEYNYPELITKEVHNHNNEAVLDSLRTAPDFIEVDDQNRVTLVEVKYRREIDGQNYMEIANSLLDKWPEAWVFIATQKGFLFDSAKNIITSGFIGPLSTDLVSLESQSAYLDIMHQFNL
jgi:hypothetical protein